MTYTTAGAAPVHSAATYGTQIGLGILRLIRNRMAVRNLAKHSNEMLKDIGLTRSDVDLARGMPLLDDPSVQLKNWVQERRQASRAIHRDQRRQLESPPVV